ncbi:hypothetical protein NM688_g3295 [Phlebia brevispora]|uniref:Uncharacterized protein n=1 Tax=Phlebia brevispora TaxID=194682 RepID=A0ACC1T6A5_9APHY|nr:hypothetical protein NM688_g3295 [Phlebia brevispora]
MPQTPEAAAFLERITQLPPGLGVSLDDALKPSLEDEAELRKLFAQDKTNIRLQDPHVGLVDVFDAPSDIKTTRARVVQSEDDLSAKYVMPLSTENRRKDGSPCMVQSLADFKANWAIFTEGSLSQLTNWNNVVAGGGAVQACLSPVPDNYKVSKRALRKYFHSHAFPTSDVDLFLYGMTPEQARAKINEIYEAVRDSVPWDVTCIRTKHTVSIHSQYPYRAIQIVLRLYQSPAEILAGFDVDAPCCAYDGDRVWASPRAIVAAMRQCNTVDITRRSPSYEVRLHKYSSRGFEVYVPDLNREDIDPTIFERSIVRVQGLARLLVLEKLATAISRDQFVMTRRNLRGRPQKPYNWKRHAKKKYKGDLKQDADAGLELSDYDVISLHIPYGPGWDARRIEKLVYQTDLGMNSPFNPKNKDRILHRHAAFFGTMKECLDDCCEHCPEAKNEEEQALQLEEDKSYVRGRVAFIEEDPGRQSMSGSFNPIDEGEWSEQAYMGATEKFFAAIAAQDRAAVKRMIQEGSDVNRRDHVGRTPLQVAILSGAEEIACDLIDANARMTARLVDGRTSLHLASFLGLAAVVRKLLERSALNDEAAKEAEEAKRQESKAPDDMATDDEDSEMQDSSEDDWASEDEHPPKNATTEKPTTSEEGVNIPDEEEDLPDVFDVNVHDWDYGFSALDYAIIGGSVPVVELLTSAGANPKSVNEFNSAQSLTLTAATPDEEAACKIMEKLLSAGAVSSEANADLFTILHRMIWSSKPKLFSALLRMDPSSKAVLDVPCMTQIYTVFPVVSAIISGSYSILALLLAYGAKLMISEDEFQRARDMKLQVDGKGSRYGINFRSSVITPMEFALSLQDDIVYLLVALDAELNCATKSTWSYTVENGRMSMLDLVRTVAAKAAEGISLAKPSRPVGALPSAPRAVASSSGMLVGHHLPALRLSTQPRPAPGATESQALLPSWPAVPAWKQELQTMASKCNELERAQTGGGVARIPPFDKIKAYFNEVEALLVSHGAKTAAELAPSDAPAVAESERQMRLLGQIYQFHIYRNTTPLGSFSFYRLGRLNDVVGNDTTAATLYNELFAACWDGDNSKIQRLCLPQAAQKTHDTPIQIAVRWGDYRGGYTPMHAALMRRHWNTARLILAIAVSQFSPEEPPAQPFTTKDLALDEDSDSDNDSEDEEMEDVPEKETVDFIDIAKRPSTVHSQANPVDMLIVYGYYLAKDEKTYRYDTLLNQVVANDDFEAFVQILDLYRYAGDALGMTESQILAGNTFPGLFQYDRPAMLDEFIRRTGFGISLEVDSKDQDEEQPDSTSRKPKYYLGLNVHGKKRKDLASKGDPNAPHSMTPTGELPILWKAARAGLLEVIKYLASDRPLMAYKFYASSHSDKQAKLLNQIPDLASVLPAKLGWTTNVLNESALTAGIVANRKEVIETLYALRPKDVDSWVHLRHKTLNFNNLLAAVRWGCDPWIFDFLLGKKVSPMEADHRGYNICHLLCSYSGENYTKLFKHVLHQLPTDVTEYLLRQQTKKKGFTPLHIAVKDNRLDYVRLLVGTSAAQYLQRNASGNTPLHLAVKRGFPEMTQVIASAGPAEALTLEDGVGSTALETVTRNAFVAQIKGMSLPTSWMNGVIPSFDWHRTAFSVPKQTRELALLRETIQDLLDQGRLINGTKLAKELLAYADHLEAKIAAEKAAEEEKTKKAAQGWTAEADTSDAAATLRVLSEALAARPGPRHLVHLDDVHESVKTSLKIALDNYNTQIRFTVPKKDDEFENPPAEEEQLPASLLVNDYDPNQMWGEPWGDVYA